ncbi:uncharacterized protein LOC142354583 [Convolutriloba macropyga]|uniref:uncharacterized protein LOC142354583 n=1 Tax=Convolutriloba macropyga TaxID=536237 RepID=UPI003F5202DB
MLLWFLTLFSSLIGQSRASVALHKKDCTVGHGKMRVVVHIAQAPNWLIAKVKNPQVEKVHLEMAAFLVAADIEIPVSIGDTYDFISVGDINVNQPQLILQKSWYQEKTVGRVFLLRSSLIEEMYPRGKLRIDYPFFAISKVEIQYIQCGDMEDTFNCKSVSDKDSGTFGSKNQYYVTDFTCDNKTAPFKPGGNLKSRLDYKDYDYSTTPRGPSTYDPETLKLFTPEDASHHQTTAFVILFFICLMVLQNVIFPIIVFTLLK